MAFNIAKYNNRPAGTYREIIDASQRPDLPFNQSRVVVGFSRKGVFNRPILINSVQEARLIFGNRDEYLEKRGSFFHRSLEHALESGPVYALNLRKLNPNGNPDLVEGQTLSFKYGIDNEDEDSITLSSLYNTDKYWSVQPEKLETELNSGTNTGVKVANIGQGVVTLLITKYEDESLDITASEWYGGGNIPEWMNPNDLISDYLVQIDIVRGNFGANKYEELATDPIFSEFFDYDSANTDSSGLKKDKHADFLGSPYTDVIQQFQGSLIPGFRDQNGDAFYVIDDLNKFNEETGLIANIDTDLFDGSNNPINLKATSDSNISSAEILSYMIDDTTTLEETLDLYTGNINGTPVTNTTTEFFVEYLNMPPEYADNTAYTTGDIIEHLGTFYQVQTDHTSDTTQNGAPDTNTNDYETYTGTINATPQIRVGDLVQPSSGDQLVRVSEVNRASEGVYVSKVTTTSPVDISGDSVTKYKTVYDAATHLQSFSLEGFTWTNNHLPDGSWASINDRILSVLTDTNIGDAIADRNANDFRYLVDSFSGGIELGSKSVFTKICDDKKNMFAILNAPSMEEFRDSNNPVFLDAFGNLSTKLIRDGGKEGTGTFNYSLPGVSDGGYFGAFYGPHLIQLDGNKEKVVPPAALVSNLYMEKYQNASPWTIIAGNSYPITGQNIVGVEHELGDDDRLNFEKIGINPIVFKNGVGLTIEGNLTAKQTPKSSLSAINGIEVVIYLQDQIEAVLQQYQWKFNNEQNRLQIKNLADGICSQVQSEGGIRDYQNIIDRSNNTDEVIDNELGVLNTYIEVAKGMRVIVNPMTILKTGGIASGQIEQLS